MCDEMEQTHATYLCIVFPLLVKPATVCVILMLMLTSMLMFLLMFLLMFMFTFMHKNRFVNKVK